MSEHELTCGIEIHQQLDTTKLFCSCRSELVESDEKTFLRRLRPTASEMGEMDRAALLESQKRLFFRYQAPPGVSCLVESDEEPPHVADVEATDTVLTFATMLNARIVDEIHFMRKLVIDGSNTSGFQRTALIAMDGHLDLNGRKIGIQSICLEEDAARKVDAGDGEITYRLDRLGIPLIEIATGPDMHTPEEVKEVALRLGTLLRATKRVKRGIGSIREDLNISIPGGSRIEIKGVQELRLLPLYVENEVKRQRMLLRIRDILSERNVAEVGYEPIDVTDIFKDCPSKVIKGALKDKGKVIAVKLPGFAGVLNGDGGSLRFGSELAGRARTRGVKGIFHSDELPAYGIEQPYVDALNERLSMQDGDAFAICAAPKRKAMEALELVVVRANEGLVGVPEETRDPLPDGSSRYSRPLPGAARMYPETDVPPVRVDEERLKKIEDNLPELPDEVIERLVSQYKVNDQQAAQLVRGGKDELFEMLAKGSDMPSVAATTLANTFPEMERDGLNVDKIDDDGLLSAFRLLSEGRFAKEALPTLLREMCSGVTAAEAIEKLGLSAMDSDEALSVVRGIVSERRDFVIEKGMAAIGPLMGPVMAELRGKVDGKEANALLAKCIKELIP